jgi:Prealbumin-like fold domain
MSKGRFSAKGSRTRDRGSWIPRAGLVSAVALLAVVAGLIVGPIASIAGAQETDTSSSSTGSQQTTPSEDPTTTTAPPASDPAPAPSSDPAPTTSDPAPTTQPAPTPTTTTAAPTIKSDKADYAPGDQVTLTGANWLPGESVHVVVNDDVGQTWSHDATVQADAAGTITDVFNLPSWFVATYSVTATGSSGRVALATFTDSSGNLDQCANGSTGTDPCVNAAWQNGNLNAQQARYLEGQSVPYRLRMDGLSTSGSHTVTIEWDTTKSGKHALDYLTSWDRDIAGGSNPCSGVTGCANPSTFAIPQDLNVPFSQVPGNFTLYNGTITGVSPYSIVSGSYAGDSTTSITINFTTTASNPVLAWGGHIATRQDWGQGNAAVNINGSPYHTATKKLDGSQTGNQDRSLSADAVIFPASVTVVKDAVPDDVQDFGFTATNLSPTSFTLDDDGDNNNGVSNTQVFSNITTFGHKVITENTVSAWDLSNIACLPNTDTTISVPNRNVDINLKEGAEVTCTFTNSRQAAHLKVIKHVINDNGGDAVAGDFTMNVTGGNPAPASFAGAESPGTDVTINPGDYSVDENDDVAGYTKTLGEGCSGTIAAGQTKTCTIINDDQAATLNVIKHLINDNGGDAVAGDFTMNVTGDNPDPDSFPGAEDPGIEVAINPGDYSVDENDDVAGYTKTLGEGCSGTIALGEHKTCTVINDDQAASLTVIKHVINDNGGGKGAGDFDLSVTGNNADPASFKGDENGTPVAIEPGHYTVDETELPGYTKSFDGECDANIALGEHKTCTVINDDQPGKIVVRKLVKPANSSTSFSFQTTGTGYSGFSLLGGQENSQPLLNAGSYTVKELVPLGWVLTGIGGSTDPNTPYNCTVTGSGGSTGVGDLNTQTATVSLKNGDTVTCVFENTGQGVTRTQGFWATHSQLANIAWFGGTAFGHTFPGVAGVTGIGDNLICGRPIDELGKVMGAFWSDIAKTSTGKKRSAIEQARMQLLQQLIAAELNASAFGSVPSGGTGAFATWETKLCGTNQNDIKNAQQQAASFNTQGDSGQFTPGTSADSKNARSVANIAFWDIVKP